MSEPNYETPNWTPLEKVERHLHGEIGRFMFMCSQDGLNYYKHKDSRSYLVLNDNGDAYGEQEGTGMAVPVGIEHAVRVALGDFHPDNGQGAPARAWWPGFDHATGGTQ